MREDQEERESDTAFQFSTMLFLGSFWVTPNPVVSPESDHKELGKHKTSRTNG